MKVVGIVIDKWKLPVFKRHLETAGFPFTEHPGVTTDTLLLKVETNFVATLQPVIEAAQRECRT
jgi:hypothetical protein